MSRNSILSAIANNKPEALDLPAEITFQADAGVSINSFISSTIAIGTKVFKVDNYEEVKAILSSAFPTTNRIVSMITEMDSLAEKLSETENPHALEDVDLTILKADFGVVENGAVWISENQFSQRVLPFITQHLAVVLEEDKIVPLMTHAYGRIGKTDYGYGVFIAGPSKTADIEQSLVIGAHGPRSLQLFILKTA